MAGALTKEYRMTDNLATVLATPMQRNDADAATIGDYLRALLADVWKYDEGFNGKRPFGNSGWKGEIYAALVAAQIVPGTIDADGYLDECDDDRADEVIARAIDFAFAEATS